MEFDRGCIGGGAWRGWGFNGFSFGGRFGSELRLTASKLSSTLAEFFFLGCEFFWRHGCGRGWRLGLGFEEERLRIDRSI
jgi:hypothetical protein